MCRMFNLAVSTFCQECVESQFKPFHEALEKRYAVCKIQSANHKTQIKANDTLTASLHRVSTDH
jgi:hypothetical protein